MFNSIRSYTYIVLVSFLVNALTLGNAFALDLEAWQDMLMSDEVIQGVFGGVISSQSESGEMDTAVAPAPRVIEQSNGDIAIRFSDSAQASVSTTTEGLTKVTYSMSGARVKVKDLETNEEFEFQYELEGSVVKLVNSSGAVVRQETYNNFGQLLTTKAQGTNTNVYSSDGLNTLVKSIDQWGNETIYDDESRPDFAQYIEVDGTVVVFRNYTFDNIGILESIVDENGNSITFLADGIRVDEIRNFAGTLTSSYQYDDVSGNLISVTDHVSDSITIVDGGQYTQTYDIVPVLDDNNNPVLDAGNEPVTELVLKGTYNYDVAGNVSAITNIGEEGCVTGWTDYDEFGRISGTYNHEGALVQSYMYNDHGFLQQTMSLGDAQTVVSVTKFDLKGRPMEVWQIGNGGNKVKIQEYVYKENGLLDTTFSLGILRGTDETNETTFNKPIDTNGNLVTDGRFTYFTTSTTEYDKKGRPSTVYSIVRNDNGDYISGYDDNGDVITTADSTQALLEKQQSYSYDKRGFLSKTTSYGFNNRATSTTQFDRYGRPEKSFNAQGEQTQEYVYNLDGFLVQTKNFGENGVQTGYTNYDAKGKPTDVYNHLDTLTQKYVYDENGLMVMSLNLNGTDGVNSEIISTMSDVELIAAMWDDSFSAEVLAGIGAYNEIEGDGIPALNEALMTAIWDENNEHTTDFKKKCAMMLIKTFSDGAKGGNQYLINDVGSAYHMLGQFLEEEGNNEGAVAAYKIQASEFTGAMAIADGVSVSVTAWSTDRLVNMTDANGDPVAVNTAVVTGYTIFGGDSKPISSYQCYDDGVNGLQVTKVQDYDYSYEATKKIIVGYDTDNKPIYEKITFTQFSNFVRKTINYGDYEDTNANGTVGDAGDVQVTTGFTVFDNYGRQLETYNEDGNVVQKYSYSKSGFLNFTYSYGKDKALTGTTVFDNYSRPIASFNAYGKATRIPADLIAALADGLSIADIENPEWQPFLKGLTQTFEYGTDGLLATSKSWGEAVVVDVSDLSGFAEALGSVKGDENYEVEFDFNEDGEINQADMDILEEDFTGSENMVNQFINLTAEKSDLKDFANTFESKVLYKATQTGYTVYDKYGKASEVYNSEPIIVDGVTVADGVLNQKYVYNERGFMTRSESYGINMDEYGNVQMQEDIPEALLTGYTLFDAGSKPTETYSVYNSQELDDQGNPSIDVMSKVQDYTYEDGFLIQTNNYARNGADAGYTTFDKYGRQEASYNENEEPQKTSTYQYSKQGFLTQTNSYGLNGAYLGKTLFNKKSRPIESYNMTGSKNTEKGLTQKFVYNDYGFLTNSISYGEDQILTGQTFYNGYGKAMYSSNDVGITNSAYVYDSAGFLDHTLALSFEVGAGPDEATHNNLNDSEDTLNTQVPESGYYVITGYTVFGDTSKPEAAYQCWGWTGDNLPAYGDGAKVQEYNYTDGFLTSTSNYGKDETFIGTTVFDKYGRQEASYNEVDVDGDGLGELTTKFKYSKQGFMNTSYNYGAKGSLVGTTTFNSLGRPEQSINQRKAVTQTFHYNEFTGALDESYSWGEPTEVDGVSTPTLTGTTEYDTWGKAQTQFNSEGSIVAKYDYDVHGFMTRAFSFSGGTATDVGVCTGFTNYNAAGRPEGAYSVFNPTTASGDLMGSWYDDYFYLGVDENTIGVTKVQDFIYNTEAEVGGDILGYIGTSDTGFLTMTVSYGDNYNADNPSESFMGYTTFNRYGQQDYSYNELNEQTTKFNYSSSGFLSETYNYGIDKTLTGKTVFNATGRPEASYNEKGALLQTFEYVGGFLTASTSYGDPGDLEVGGITGTTSYDIYGKQDQSLNAEGTLVGTFEYSVNGFMTKSNTWGYGLDNTTGETGSTITGFTNYDNKVRPENSYAVYESWLGYNESLSQVFSYDNDGEQTGFVTGAQTYVVNNDHNFGTDNIANDIDTGEVLLSGTVEYNHYGRPEQTYNKEGAIVSKNIYSSNGFITKTDNYGEDGKKVGSLYFSDVGRPLYATNHSGGVTTEYVYNNAGFLNQTIGYIGGSINEETGDIEGVMSSYTTFDVYSKAQETFQLWTMSESSVNSEYYQFDENGTANYTINGDGSISDGGLTSVNQNADISHYNAFGSLLQTDNKGRQGSTVSSTMYDSFSKPTSIWNDKGSLVQVYHYSAQGFLDYSISYATMKSYNDRGNPVDDGDWDTTTETSITFFNTYGQQTNGYVLSNDSSSGQEGWDLVNYVQNIDNQTGLELGAKQSEYKYDNNGFLSQTKNYQDKQYIGYTTFDLSGRQDESFNQSGTLTTTYLYDLNGFLNKSASHG